MTSIYIACLLHRANEFPLFAAFSFYPTLEQICQRFAEQAEQPEAEEGAQEWFQNLFAADNVSLPSQEVVDESSQRGIGAGTQIQQGLAFLSIHKNKVVHECVEPEEDWSHCELCGATASYFHSKPCERCNTFYRLCKHCAPTWFICPECECDDDHSFPHEGGR